MYSIDIMGCRGITVRRTTPKCLSLGIEVERGGTDRTGNYVLVTRTETVALYGLPEATKSALEAALNTVEAGAIAAHGAGDAQPGPSPASEAAG